MLNHIKYFTGGEHTGTKIYTAAADIGKIQLGISVLICVIIAFVLFTFAYFNNKNWNHNLIDITGTVVKINTPSGSCNTSVQQNGNSQTVTYDCPITAKYSMNTPSPSTVNIHTIGSTNYNVGQPINMSYDMSTREKPTVQVFRYQTWWFIAGGVFFLFAAYVDYLIAKSTAMKPYQAFLGANAVF